MKRKNVITATLLTASLALGIVWLLLSWPAWIFYVAVIVPWLAAIYWAILLSVVGRPQTWRGWGAAIGIPAVYFLYTTFFSANYWIYSECEEVPSHHHCWEAFCERHDCSGYDEDNPPPGPRWIP